MTVQEAGKKCRVCGSKDVVFVAHYQPYLDYGTPIHDCTACGCRFAEHNARAHEMLHANRSPYDSHARRSEIAARHFARSEVGELKLFLSRTPKNRFVISFIDARPAISKVAEIGCSRGYLSSYFIATGRQFHGFDISETAVTQARRVFGDHFHVMDYDLLQELGGFDAIFHVGTIGCVDKPIEMTAKLLAALKPGGWLLFNAPVKEHLDQTQLLWLDTPPPDLVTIFPGRFWQATFGSLAEVDVSFSYCSIYEAFLCKRKSRRATVASRNLLGGGTTHRARSLLAEALRRGLARFASPIVSPYGAFVVMKKMGEGQ